jgi:hypothetical protein
MPERIFPGNADVSAGFPNWGAIWAGTFSFIAIWSVFGFLGAAIFASVANPNVPSPLAGIGVGMGIWAVVLTIIAMFVAGRTTGRLAGRTDPIMNGTVTFGLSITSALIVAIVAELALGTLVTRVAGTHLLGTFVGLGWIGFVALFLGWLAAIGGAFSAAQRRAAESPAEQARRAA